jgi:hypothetical protein
MYHCAFDGHSSNNLVLWLACMPAVITVDWRQQIEMSHLLGLFRNACKWRSATTLNIKVNECVIV